MVIDGIDSEILKIMREEGRISWRDLGAAVGLSANAAADRVRRLRQAGVITGFTALVDPGAGGRRLEALVGVTVASDTDSDDFANAAAQLEPVLEVLHLQRHAGLSAASRLPRHGGARRSPPHAPQELRRGGHGDHAHPAVGAGARSVT